MKIFVDTGAWLALEISKDKNHAEAKLYARELKNKRALFFTNEYILAETYTRLIYDVYLKAARQFHENIKFAVKQEGLIILEVDTTMREKSWEELERYSDHKLSFADATIVANFKTYKLDAIFTFDKHFTDITLPTNLSA